MHDLFEISTQKTSDEKRPTHVCALRTHCRNDILIRRTAHDRERSTARHSVTVPDMSAEVSALAKAGHCVLYPARARAHAAHSYAVRKGSAQVLSLCVTSLIQLHQPYVRRLLKSAHVLYSPIPRQRICPRSTACIRSRASLPRGVTTRILHRSIIAQPQVFPPSDVSRRGCFSSLPDRFTWAAQRLPLCTGTQKRLPRFCAAAPWDIGSKSGRDRCILPKYSI